MKHHLKVFLCILLGNAMLAFSVCAFVVPNGIMLGGSTGIALAIQHALPFSVRLSLISAGVNGALFLLGWACMGWKFAATSLMSTILQPLFLAVFEMLPVGNLFHEDLVFSALFCAVAFGLGIGLVVRVGASTGGMDIPPCILHKYKGIPVGASLMVFDTLVVLIQVLQNGLDGVLCSLLVVAVMSITVNKAVLIGDSKVQITIISPKYQQIRDKILTDINCGVTLLDIETGYAGVEQKAIMSVVYTSKYLLIRDAALALDPEAFIIASDVTNVHGQGYSIPRAESSPHSPR